MKKSLLNALFMGLAVVGFAQTPFTEQTVHGINKRFIEDPKKSTADDFAPDYVLYGAEGQKATAEQLGKMMAGVKHLDWKTTDLTVKQYGNVAIAHGITKHSLVSLNDNVTHAYHVRATYIYEFQKDRWRWISASHTNILSPKADEEAAVKKVLVEERKAYFAGDKDIEKYWKDDPKTVILTSYPSGRQGVIDNERRKTFVSQFKAGGNGHVGTITSSKVQVYGKMAVANVEMTVNYKNGSEAKERHLINLEKNGDNWQIINYALQGIPKDVKEDSTAIVKVIEKETQSWHDRNVEGRIACIANVPYAQMLVYHGTMANNNGVAYVTNEKTNAPEMMKTQMESMGKPNGTTFKNENYVVTIKGGTAFVSYEEITTAADGKKMYGHAVRNLEKIEGFWKLTYIGGVIYKRD